MPKYYAILYHTTLKCTIRYITIYDTIRHYSKTTYAHGPSHEIMLLPLPQEQDVAQDGARSDLGFVGRVG